MLALPIFHPRGRRALCWQATLRLPETGRRTLMSANFSTFSSDRLTRARSAQSTEVDTCETPRESLSLVPRTNDKEMHPDTHAYIKRRTMTRHTWSTATIAASHGTHGTRTDSVTRTHSAPETTATTIPQDEYALLASHKPPTPAASVHPSASSESHRDGRRGGGRHRKGLHARFHLGCPDAVGRGGIHKHGRGGIHSGR